MSGRRAVACVGLLLLILLTTGALSWWSWQTLQDRRVQLGAEQELRPDQPEVRSLTDDLVRRHEQVRGSAPVEEVDGPAVQPPGQLARPAASGGGITVPGHILAGLVITVALCAAGAGSWLVLQRYARAAAAALSRSSAPVPGNHTDTGDDTDTDTGDDTGDDTAEASEVPLEGEDRPGPAVATPPSEDVDRDAQDLLAMMLVPQRQPDPDEELSGTRVKGSATGRDDLLVPAAVRREVEPTLPARSSSYDDLATDVAVRQRLYDRRVARRVPHVQPGWLWWAALNAPVTVRDVSDTGLRCVLSSASGSAAAQPPGLGETARIIFPVDGSTVKVGVRVQWKDATAEGTDLGLAFVDLKQEDAALLSTLLDTAD